MANTTVMLFFTFLLAVGGILLQIFLSRRENRWFGLILPLITFLYSLLSVFNVAVFDDMTAGKLFLLMASTFLLKNIPTIVLLVIYFGCREKRKRRAQLDKMNIQDLD